MGGGIRVAVEPGRESMRGGFRDQHAAIPSAARDDPRGASVLELRPYADRFSRWKNENFGTGARIGDHDSRAPATIHGTFRCFVSGGALFAENPRFHAFVLIRYRRIKRAKGSPSVVIGITSDGGFGPIRCSRRRRELRVAGVAGVDS